MAMSVTIPSSKAATTDQSTTSWWFQLVRNSRFYILLGSAALAGLVYLIAANSFGASADLATILSRQYSLIAVFYLYLAILITPLYKRFPALPAKVHVNHARRAIGVSAWAFSVTHTAISLWGQLGGTRNLGYISPKSQLSLLLGLISLIVLFLLAALSFDFVIRKLGFPLWKKIQRLVYLAAVAALLHVVLIGADFHSLGDPMPAIAAIMLIFLLYLEAIRIATWRLAPSPKK